MLFQAKLVVFGKSMYQKAFLSFENRLNVDLSFNKLSWVINLENLSNILGLIKSRPN